MMISTTLTTTTVWMLQQQQQQTVAAFPLISESTTSVSSSSSFVSSSSSLLFLSSHSPIHRAISERHIVYSSNGNDFETGSGSSTTSPFSPSSKPLVGACLCQHDDLQKPEKEVSEGIINHESSLLSTSLSMPEWLQQTPLSSTSFHTVEDASSVAGKRNAVNDALTPSNPRSSAMLPPWLTYNQECVPSGKHDLKRKVAWLEYSLLQHGFSDTDATDIVQTIYAVVANNGDHNHRLIIDDLTQPQSELAWGMLDFCQLMLQVDSSQSALLTEQTTDHGRSTAHHPPLLSKAVLQASIIHYAECVAARRQGVQDILTNVLLRQTSSSSLSSPPVPALSPCSTSSDNEVSTTTTTTTTTTQTIDSTANTGEMSWTRHSPAPASSSGNNQQMTSRTPEKNNGVHLDTVTVSEEALWIAQGAARIKRAEIMAAAVMAAAAAADHHDRKKENGEITSVELSANMALTPQDAQTQQGLLLSVMDDWRSFAIRCVAALYRLEGILQQQQQQQAQRLPSSSQPALGRDVDGSHARQQQRFNDRTPEIVQTARGALRVYATLAQRLGMYPLKAMIEERAFRILYQKQYRVVSSLYQENERIMYRLSNFLFKHISQQLYADDKLMGQLEHLQVTARVKEPFSFWKKLLKQKYKEKELSLRPCTPNHESSLDITDVQDGIAIRIVLRARKLSDKESNESTRARERLLCYYVQNLVRSTWPEVDPTRVKDYIQYPKSNGYQSLHHTSSIRTQNIEFPFEIQIRTEEMHHRAEFGVAAHWDYKLGNTPAPSSPYVPEVLVEKGEPENDAPLLAHMDNADLIVSSSTLNSLNSNRDDVPAPLFDSTNTGSRERTAMSSSYLDALETAKQEIVNAQVYVFMVGQNTSSPTSSSLPSPTEPFRSTGGHLVSLPSNSRVRDALTVVNGDLQVRWPTVRRNGMVADLDDSVKNGDVIVISSE